VGINSVVYRVIRYARRAASKKWQKAAPIWRYGGAREIKIRASLADLRVVFNGVDLSEPSQLVIVTLA